MSETLPEKEQEEALAILVEAHRNVPRDKREAFLMMTTDETNNAYIWHPGLPSGNAEIYEGDINILSRAGLIAFSDKTFEITSRGFAYYKWMKEREGQPVQRIESNSRSYLETATFRQKYAKAYEKWSDAEGMLWDSDSERQMTTIGHLCREAIQEFATSLINQYQPPNVDMDKAHTVARIKVVLNSRANKFGSSEKPFLDALIAYWGTVSDLIQRQEHGGQKEGNLLAWDDARRVVFQTYVVMFEIDRSLARL
ncbi:MAG: hypothetical protein QOH25_3472 [Acidobacteriota bacterium]|jgi:hypothetical protein|nr:hypothetical protein [Acidobacteriota bacterium]